MTDSSNKDKRNQPQGVDKILDVSTLPDTGFFTNEFAEDAQIVLPNKIYIDGEQATVPLVVNDGLLRTHTDVMNLHVYPTSAQTIDIIVPKLLFKTLAEADADADTYIAFRQSVELEAGENVMIFLTRSNDTYTVSAMSVHSE